MNVVIRTSNPIDGKAPIGVNINSSAALAT